MRGKKLFEIREFAPLIKNVLVNQIFTLTRRVSEYDVSKLATCAKKVSQTSQDVFYA